MSADNFVGIRSNADGTYSVFEYGSMSMEMEDCQYLADKTGRIFPFHQDALAFAHNSATNMAVCEYGVIEMDTVAEPCGRCYVCVHERKLIAEDIAHCDGCHEPISDGEWRTLVNGGTYHNRCEPERALLKRNLTRAAPTGNVVGS